MSEHLIEDLVADSVVVLDGHAGEGDPRVRDWFAALYDFESGHDCSFTRFRVMDVLLRRGYTYRFPLDRHPDHSARPDHFAARTEFTALREFDEDAPGFAGYDSWLQDGYVDPPWLYCDAGTDLWHRMVTAGDLTGPAAAPLRRTRLVEVVREIAVAAEEHQDRELIGLWYAFGCEALIGTALDVAELAEMPAVQDLRAIVRRTDALPAAQESPCGCPIEAAADEDLEAWWWRL
ncbi:hypothetical protein BBK82_40830 [Lentzea guizhouensis]|uniref:Uncharacterized protein n=1 Tax=Lentzea guizhouensis TaxID=1586287 RepID=A0A1B2HUE9_9PSEU|nr:hypothetical protein [Lentzea guizhouensis]ANZ41369.1 hypothetical protein BBK82_40830 [Lentzea guizhouensis]